MDPGLLIQLFLLKVLGFGAVAGYLLSVLQPSRLPQAIQSRPYAFSIAAALVLQTLYDRVVFPRFISPLRHVPTVKGVSRAAL